MGADADAQTITLLQRQWRDGAHVREQDADVTLHFNGADADALSLRW